MVPRAGADRSQQAGGVMVRPFQTFDVVGTQVSALSPASLVETVRGWQGDGRVHYVCFADANSLIQARENEAMREALAEADVVSPDGTPLMVVGVTKSSLLQPPRLWFLLCENFLGPCVVMYLRGLRNALIHLDQLFPKIVTYVEKDWAKGQKFAKFCGFKPTKTELEMYGRKLVLMER